MYPEPETSAVNVFDKRVVHTSEWSTESTLTINTSKSDQHGCQPAARTVGMLNVVAGLYCNTWGN